MKQVFYTLCEVNTQDRRLLLCIRLLSLGVHWTTSGSFTSSGFCFRMGQRKKVTTSKRTGNKPANMEPQ